MKSNTYGIVNLPTEPSDGLTPPGAAQASPDGDFTSFKDTMNRHRTQSLFIEYAIPEYPAYYTLKTSDHTVAGTTYPSLYKIYFEMEDPTEYDFAIRCFGSWKHWEILSKASWFAPIVAEWRAELKVKLEAKRYREMCNIRDSNPPKSQAHIQAVKWLSEYYSPKTTARPRRGRPSKEEKENRLKQELAEEQALEQDAIRLGLYN